MIQSDWNLLITLFDEKNITKTAGKLFLSQPAVTKRLKSLEEEFGVAIVKRTPKGVVFTDEGLVLVDYARDMLKSYGEIQNKLIKMSKKENKTIKIGIPNGFARRFLTKILSEFRAVDSDVDFEIVTGWSSGIIKQVDNEEVDVAIVRGEHKSNKGSILLFDEDIYIISLDRININDLPKLTKLEFETDMEFDKVMDNWWKSHYSSQPKKKMKVDRSDICIKMVSQGLGYAILPLMDLDVDSYLNKIKIYDKNNNAMKRVTRLYYSDNFPKQDVGKEFIEFIKSLDFFNHD